MYIWDIPTFHPNIIRVDAVNWESEKNKKITINIHRTKGLHAKKLVRVSSILLLALAHESARVAKGGSTGKHSRL